MQVFFFGVAPSEYSGPTGQSLPPFVRETESGRRVHRLVTHSVTLDNAADVWPGRKPGRATDRLPPPSAGLNRLRTLVAGASEDNLIGIVLASPGYWQQVIMRATKEGWAEPPAAGPLTGPIKFKHRDGKVVGEAIILPHPRGWPLPRVRGRQKYRRALLNWLPRAKSGLGATPWHRAWVAPALARLGL